jgi:hypothetical protein
MEFPNQKHQYKLMTGAAMVVGATAASARFGGRGDELGPALEAESGDFLAYFAAVALGTLDFWFTVEDDLLEVLVAFGAMIFKYGHSRAPFFL